jgi:hypothetical protein
MKKKLFEFWTNNEFLNKDIAPVRTIVPEWYKQTERIIASPPDREITKGLKACAPFLDALTTGYVLKLSQDIRVSYNVNGNNDYFFHWNEDKTGGVQVRPRDEKQVVPIPTGYSKVNVTWDVPFTIRIPKGYSVLVTHPLNRTDLPFFSLSGIVDADEGLRGGFYPFFIKEGFEGVIPAGTPVLQYIPFKRDNWNSEWVPELEQVSKKHIWLSRRVLIGWYKNEIWKKKNYE